MNISSLAVATMVLGAVQAVGQTLPVDTETAPQIVRVSYVEGDVRLSRGKAGEKVSGSAWEKAAVDVPLASGFSLVTGNGRAEVEFEDTSTAYVAGNSVLEFGDLSSTGGVPHTEVALVSGTMTLDVRPMAAGEWFTVMTPTDRFLMRYPDKTYVRVTSCLDGMTLTPLANSVLHGSGRYSVGAAPGTAVTLRGGMRIFPAKPEDQTAFAAWDAWVAGRVAARDATTAATMKAAGLDTPIPGLAAMAGKGEFFDCAPYGKCWQPTNGWQAGAAMPAAVSAQTVSVAQLRQGGGKINGVASTAQVAPQFVEDEYFPCSPLRVRNLVEIDPVTGKKRILSSTAYPLWYGGRGAGGLQPAAYSSGSPYDWAVCHAGSWIRTRGRYAWVVGRRRHHRPPVRWVRQGRNVGFVPIHPCDVAGQAPINLKDGLFRPTDKKGETVERLMLNVSRPVKLLDDAPAQFGTGKFLPLQRAEAPKVAARSLADNRDGPTITFDRKTQTAMVARSFEGGKTVVGPVGVRGPVETMRSGVSTTSGTVARSYSGGGGSGGGGAVASHASAPAPSAAAPVSAPSASASAGAKH